MGVGGSLAGLPPEMKCRREVYDRSCDTQLGWNVLLLWASEVATNGTFMLGLDKVEKKKDIRKLEPGKLHELTLVLS